MAEVFLPVISTTTVVLVNFNSGAHLETCLRSIAEHAPLADVIVVDNASSDGSEGAAAGRGARDPDPQHGQRRVRAGGQSGARGHAAATSSSS